MEQIKPPRWTPAEIAYLTRHYAYKSSAYLSARIKRVSGNERTMIAIQHKAHRLGLADATPPNQARVAWARLNNRSEATQYLLKRARADGVLTRQDGARGRPYLVPNEWLDHALEQYNAGAHGHTRDEILNTWWDTPTAAAYFGLVKTHFVSRTIYTRGELRAIFVNVRRWRNVHVPGHKYYWEPSDVRRAKLEYANHKRATAGITSSDNLLRNHANSTIKEAL